MWSGEDFRLWLGTQDPETQSWGEGVLAALAEEDTPLLLVFKRSDYEAWKASIQDPDIAASLEQTARTVRAGNAPSYLREELQASKNTERGIDTSLQASALQDSDELVVVPMVGLFCAFCLVVVIALIGWILSRFVFDPTWDAMVAYWEEHKTCPYCHSILQSEGTTCNYECIYCHYGHLTVDHDWGIYANVYCDSCYGLFRISNPLY